MTEDFLTLAPGFDDPTHDAQRVFRQILDAVSMPGRAVKLNDAFQGLDGLSDIVARPLAAALLALADFETPVWLDSSELADLAALIRFHGGAPITQDPAQAAFAVIRHCNRLPALSTFAWGTPEYPDRSTTLLIQVDALSGGAPIILSGPGIPERQQITPRGLPAHFWTERAQMQRDFPCGVDCFLFSRESVIGLPRTTLAQAVEA
jgi:alpha-D-ribose 1-methylphosphonate 5-triphosphate synthase subunit PhnH